MSVWDGVEGVRSVDGTCSEDVEGDAKVWCSACASELSVVPEKFWDGEGECFLR